MKIAGFEFESEKEYEKARKELHAIRYIKEQTKMDNPDMVLKVYHALIEQETFETVVGYAFLEELQTYLLSIPYIKNEDVKPIRVRSSQPVVVEKKVVEKKESGKYKRLFYVCFFFCILFLCIIGGMFAITHYSGDSITILNYENKLIDKYEAWEKELIEREQKLIELEEK